jgi:hypothetical protein
MPPSASASAPTPLSAAMSAPVNAKPELAVATGTVPVTTMAVDAESPSGSVAMRVCAPGVVSEGIVTTNENDPEPSAVVVPTVTGVEWSVTVTVAPGVKLLPLNVTDPPGATDELLDEELGAFGPYANAGVANATLRTATAEMNASLAFISRPPFVVLRIEKLPNRSAYEIDTL